MGKTWGVLCMGDLTQDVISLTIAIENILTVISTRRLRHQQWR